MQASVLATRRCLLQRLKTWTVVHKWLQIEREFSPILRKFCILLHCQPSQTEIVNGTQPNFAKRWTVNHAENLPQKRWGPPSWKKLGTKNFTFVRFLPNLRLNGEYLLKETWYRQLGKGVGKYEGSPTLSEKFMNLVHRRLKISQEFLPTLTILFPPS